jgi:pimeloyl-ACP methyl ester carboxylesterase
MGGLIGLVLAGQPDLPLPVPVRRLVLNDVGPVIEWRALQRIGEYCGHVGHFDSVQQAADAMWRDVRDLWPAHARAVACAVAGRWCARSPRWRFHASLRPRHRRPVSDRDAASGRSRARRLLWQLYDAVPSETLLLRGALSDLLSRQTAEAMTRRGPKARLVEIEGVGHAPTLIAQEQIDVVASFLLNP